MKKKKEIPQNSEGNKRLEDLKNLIYKRKVPESLVKPSDFKRKEWLGLF